MDPILEKHVIETTRDHIIRDIDSGFLKARSGYVKAWYKYELRYSSRHDLYPTIRAEHIDGLCAEARKDEEVFEIVKFFAGKRIAQGGNIPPPMTELISDFLLGAFAPIGPGSGRRKNWGRDIIILMAMKEVLRSHDIHATHRRILTSDPDRRRKFRKSASEIVQNALGKTAIGIIDVHRIHKIWESKAKRAELEIFWNLRISASWDDEPGTVLI
ncbi:MAG: hypothetical protein HRU33_12175 [Rhodobacteraceae bacterium]|nr:hypothetical protein [Paracoccaceae bacterium]